jgi:capsular exopolysaccharide synthesis family protein
MTREHQIVPYVARSTPGTHVSQPPPQWTGVGPIGELFGILARRWRTVAATTLVAVALTGIYCLFAQPRYQAGATLLIEPQGPEVLPSRSIGGAEEPFGSMKYDYYLTQYRLLDSPTIAQRVIDELRLGNDLRFTAGLLDETDADGRVAPSTPALLGKYMEGLGVQPVRMTRLVRVTFDSNDPELAAEVANAHAQAFVKHYLERSYVAMEKVRDFLESKLKELLEKMQAADEALMDYQSAHHLLPVDLRKDVASERLMDLSRRLTEAEAQRIVVEAEYRLVESGDYRNVPAVLTNGTVQRLQGEYNKLELEHALLAAKWRPTYPALRRLKAQMDHAHEMLEAEITKAVKGVEARYLAASDTVNRIKAELENQRKALLERKDQEGQLLTLARDAETTRSLYDNLVAQVKELDILGGANISHISNINVVEPASIPRHPSAPRTAFNLLLSLVAGLMIGTGIAFLREVTDSTIRDVSGVQRATGLGTLAIVPELEMQEKKFWQRRSQAMAKLPAIAGNGATIPSGDGRPTLALSAGWASAEAYRTLRTSLLLRQEPSAPRVIVITSATGTEGKTTTAVNTAASLASCGLNVLLIDGDLRLPRCHDSLGQPLKPGLGEYLGGQLRSQPIQTTHVANLSFVAAGHCRRNPTELLSSWRMWQLVRSARERFDYIIIDSPPVLAVSDGLLLANIADGVILVVENRRSRGDQANAAMTRLHAAGATVLGAVLNRGEVGNEYYQYTWPEGETVEDGVEVVSERDDAMPVA